MSELTIRPPHEAYHATSKAAQRQLREEAAPIFASIQAAMNEAHRTGFHATGHALHEVLQKAGWELAERISFTPGG